ncbi:MAG: glycyl-radical enzyme activating protein [Christensenellaceae bacterium]|jgi:pyruvate formate lyase activating enzyme
MSMQQGLIFDIQHFSLHDGPGIRTTAFLKGCNLSCAWCHNPESIAKEISIGYESVKCIQCGACILACPMDAHKMTPEGHIFVREKCTACGTCVKVCMANALIQCGKRYESDTLLKELLRDKKLYDISGGGVTFSGGEPLLQSGFLAEMARLLKKEGVHVAIDTALNVPWENIERCMAYTDLFLVDFKLFDNAAHKTYTNVPNERIKENLRYLSLADKPIWIRIPLLQGVNDALQNHYDTAEFLATLKNIEQVDLLSYHNFGIEKGVSFGQAIGIFEAPTTERLQQIKEIYEKKGYEITVS